MTTLRLIESTCTLLVNRLSGLSGKGQRYFHKKGCDPRA